MKLEDLTPQERTRFRAMQSTAGTEMQSRKTQRNNERRALDDVPNTVDSVAGLRREINKIKALLRE